LDFIYFLFFRANIGIGQGSALLSILSAFYIISIFHILEKKSKNLSIPIFILLFVEMVFLFLRKIFLKNQI